MSALLDLARAIAADQALPEPERAAAYAIAQGEPRIVASLLFTRWRLQRERGVPAARVILRPRVEEAGCPSE